jgi:hypothetical protein
MGKRRVALAIATTVEPSNVVTVEPSNVATVEPTTDAAPVVPPTETAKALAKAAKAAAKAAAEKSKADAALVSQEAPASKERQADAAAKATDAAKAVDAKPEAVAAVAFVGSALTAYLTADTTFTDRLAVGSARFVVAMGRTDAAKFWGEFARRVYGAAGVSTEAVPGNVRVAMARAKAVALSDIPTVVTAVDGWAATDTTGETFTVSPTFGSQRATVEAAKSAGSQRGETAPTVTAAADAAATVTAPTADAATVDPKSAPTADAFTILTESEVVAQFRHRTPAAAVALLKKVADIYRVGLILPTLSNPNGAAK